MKFEFKVRTADGDLWTQLQGNGGQVGNGCLYQNVGEMPEEKREALVGKLLVRARHELEADEGVARIWKGGHLPPAERIIELEVEEILEARYVGRTVWRQAALSESDNAIQENRPTVES